MDDKELSAEDLREKLFHTFQSRGVLESLKSQLRNRLVNELQQTAKANLANGKKKLPEEPLLFYHAANSLVVDHLEKCNFDYTLSVFLPESGTSKDKIYTVKDLLHLLKVDKESHLYQSLESSLSSKINSKSFLWEIVSQFSSLCGHNKQSTMVQTDEYYSLKSPSVAEKLKFVDKAFSGQAERENESWSMQSEQKIIDFQKKCEERKKAELAAEIQRFKASELSRIRIEEKEQCQKAIKMAKEQMEKDYFLKAETLRLKDRELIEREDRFKKTQEQEAYAQRQKILEDIQVVKERENDLKRKQELQERFLKLEEEKIKVEAEKLKEKEMSLKDQESRVQQKVEDEIQRFKFQHQESYQKRLHDLELKDAQFKQDKYNFDKSKAQYLGYYDDLEEKKEQLQKLQSQLEASKYNSANLQQQKDSLLHKLEQVKDYSSLKNNENALQVEKIELQRLLEEERSKEKGYKATIKELKDKNSKPSSELVSVRNELKAVKDDTKNKDKLSKERQKKLEVRLQQESHRCVEYQRLYEEGLLRQKEMERESDDLRAALHHTQSLLRMELERRRFSEASVSDVSLSSPPPEPSPIKSTMEYPTRPRQNSDRNNDLMDDTGTTQELISNSKEVFDKLEKDAKGLEESYRRFQSRMKNTGLDQFTSVHPVSLEKHVNFSGPHANTVGAQPQMNLGTKNGKASAQEHFVPLSWIPASDNKVTTISYMASGHVGGSLDPPQFAPSLRPQEDTTNTDSGTRFYSLPSFGVSELTQNTPAPRYFGLSTTNRRAPNNTVNVSDLIAKPGSPSIISAPIDHSSMPSTITEINKSTQDNIGYSSGELTRRPLSSTIDRGKEGTGFLSRDTGFLTSSNVQKNNSHVPVIDGSVFHGRKSDTDSENDSHRSSDASLSGGYLTMGTLNKPARSSMDRKQDVTKPSNGKDENTSGKVSLDGAWRGTTDKELNATEQRLGGDSINSDHTHVQRQPISLDSAWKSSDTNTDNNDDFYARKERDALEERDKVDREERDKLEREQRDRLEREKREREERDKLEQHEKNREAREREEREWQEEQRKREELRRKREEEAWEREQRELVELQRQQELQERGRNDKRNEEKDGKDKEQESQEDKNIGQEEEEKEKKLDIDPVMLQYMQMIQKKKEDEQKAKAVESTQQEIPAKEPAGSSSNSAFSHGGDEGSLEDLSGDDGFDWG